jgi:hypothetical protein
MTSPVPLDSELRIVQQELEHHCSDNCLRSVGLDPVYNFPDVVITLDDRWAE